MKRFLSLCCIVMLVFASVPAQGEGIFDRLGSFLSSTVELAEDSFDELREKTEDVAADVWQTITLFGTEAWNKADAAAEAAGKWFSATGNHVRNALVTTWDSVLSGLKANAVTIMRLWNGFSQFAERNGITVDSVLKIALPLIASFLAARLHLNQKPVEEMLLLIADVFIFHELTKDEALDAVMSLLQNSVIGAFR